MSYTVVKLTKDNYPKYMQQVADLEEQIIEELKQKEIGDYYLKTNFDDIIENLTENRGTVFVVLDEEENVCSSTILLNKPLNYVSNKGQAYDRWVREQFNSESEYRSAMLDAYSMKLKAYSCVKERILFENPDISDLAEFLRNEGNSKRARNILRKINKGIREFEINNGISDEMEMFYCTTVDDIAKEFNRNPVKSNEMSECEYVTKLCDSQELFDDDSIRNSDELVFIDTFFTRSKSRGEGLAKILLFEGIKNRVEEFFNNSSENELTIASVAHGDNLSRKSDLDFLGMSRVNNSKLVLNRQIYAKSIKRDEVEDYLKNMQEKLAVLYDYNPNEMRISIKRRIEILSEEIRYITKETRRTKNYALNTKTKSDENGRLNYKTLKEQYFRGIIRRKMEKILKMSRRKKFLEEKQDINPEL